MLKISKPRIFTDKYWAKWFRVASSHANIAILNPRQIYILPTRWGILYAVMLVLLLVGSINYSISLGYYITFLLASLGNMAMLYNWRNLVHLQVATHLKNTGLPAEPVFAGSTAMMTIQLTETKNRARYAIALQFEENPIITADVATNSSQVFLTPLQTMQRGWQTLPRIKLHTEFPLMLFHAWAYVDNPQKILVYAKPSDNNTPPPISSVGQNGGKQLSAKGDEDFDGHKTYQTGDAPSRVDWKASSKGVGMLSKQYSGNGSATLILDWDMTAGLDVEARISLLTKWVVDAHVAQQHFALKLPNITLPADHTEAHYHQALSTLALM